MRWRDDRRSVQWDRNAIFWYAVGFFSGLIAAGILRCAVPAIFQ